MNSVTNEIGARVCRWAKKAMPVLGAGLLALLFSAPLFSQANMAHIVGTVTDQSGAPVAGATVTVTNLEQNVSRSVTTDEGGQYSFPALLPGMKKLRVEYKGFKTVERDKIQVEVGRDLNIDFTLHPGAVTETVTIEEAAPMVETTNAELGGALSNQTINDLPLNGRNYQNLLTLRPGVTIYAGGGGWTQSTNGIRPDDNMYLLDGLSQNEPWTGMSIVNGSSLAGDVQTFVPLDAIQEFKTQENPRAEYGFKPGGVVNVGLKAGTNSIHGTAYAFGRTDAWDAKNYFDNTANGFPPFPLELEQYGATAGGPIKKDKVFWFGSYEGQSYSTAGSFTAPSPVTCGAGDPGCGLATTGLGSLAANNGCGSFPAGAIGNCNISIVDACRDMNRMEASIAPLSAKLAGLNTATCAVSGNTPGKMVVPGGPVGLFPVNLATTVPGTNTVYPNLTNVSRADNALVKIDYHLNERHILNGYYFFGQNDGTWADDFHQLAPNWQSLLHVRAQLVSGAWIWTPNSRWVNEARGGYGRYTQTYFAADHKIPATAYGINSGVTNPLYGGSPILFFVTLGMQAGASWPKLVGPDGVYDFVDHVSYARGTHNFKFGGEIQDNVHTGTITAFAKGRVKFKPFGGFGNELENFLAGNVGKGSSILTGNAHRDSHYWSYALFMQDDWRVRPGITLNLGLRYELNTVLKEAHNLLGNFDPAVGMVQVGKQIPDLYNGDHNNFAPRVGLAWDVRGNGRTVVRLGAGITYEQIGQQSFMALGNLLGAPADPTAATLVVNGVATPGTGTIDLQAVSFNDSACPGGRKLSCTLTAGWKNNSAATSVFPGNPSPVCGDNSIAAGVNFGLPAAPCTIFAVNRNLRTPYVTQWNLGIQHAITRDMTLDVSYVGNHGTKLIGFRDINQINPTDPRENTADCVHCEDPTHVPFPQFPYLNFINQLSNLYNSNYHAMQVTLTQRPAHGLSFTLGYTYSHALDFASSNWSGAGVIDNGYNPKAYYGNSDFDLRHRFTVSLTYAIPGRKGFAQMLEGWKINSIVTLQSGAHWGMLDTGNDFSGTGQSNNIPAALGEHWDFFGTANDFKSNQSSIPYCSGANFGALFTDPNDPLGTNPGGCTQTTPGGLFTFPLAQANIFRASCFAATSSIVDPTGMALANLDANTPGAGGCFAKGKSVMVPPAFGTWATAGRNIFPSYPFKNWDMSVYKDWKIKERLTVQFRAEFFNVLNHPQFANPGGGPNGFNHNDPSVANLFGCGCATPDVAGENPVLGSGSNRAIQLGLKLIF